MKDLLLVKQHAETQRECPSQHSGSVPARLNCVLTAAPDSKTSVLSLRGFGCFNMNLEHLSVCRRNEARPIHWLGAQEVAVQQLKLGNSQHLGETDVYSTLC